jgi:DNA-directed RNA polymerase subunit RPC12/RpoP
MCYHSNITREKKGGARKTMRELREMPKYKCGRCGAEWIPRTLRPMRCPKCKTPYWNKPRKYKVATEKF